MKKTIAAVMMAVVMAMAFTSTAYAGTAARAFITVFDAGMNTRAYKCEAMINKLTDKEVVTGVKDRAAGVYHRTRSEKAKHVALTMYFACEKQLENLNK